MQQIPCSSLDWYITTTGAWNYLSLLCFEIRGWQWRKWQWLWWHWCFWVWSRLGASSAVILQPTWVRLRNLVRYLLSTAGGNRDATSAWRQWSCDGSVSSVIWHITSTPSVIATDFVSRHSHTVPLSSALCWNKFQLLSCMLCLISGCTQWTTEFWYRGMDMVSLFFFNYSKVHIFIACLFLSKLLCKKKTKLFTVTICEIHYQYCVNTF